MRESHRATGTVKLDYTVFDRPRDVRLLESVTISLSSFSFMLPYYIYLLHKFKEDRFL